MFLLTFQSCFSNHFWNSVSDPKFSQSISFLPQRRLLLLGTKSVIHVSISIYTGIPFQAQLGCLLLLEAFPDLSGWVNCLLWAPATPVLPAASAAHSELSLSGDKPVSLTVIPGGQ